MKVEIVSKLKDECRSEGYKLIMEFCGCVVGSERVVNAWVLLLLLSRGRVRYSNPMGVV